MTSRHKIPGLHRRQQGPPSRGLWATWSCAELLEIPEPGLDRLEWLGEGFEPEAFDLEQINHKLARL